MKIIIVDDHNFFAESLHKFLMKFSLKFSFKIEFIKIFNSGRDIINYIKENDVDIILIDFNMPELNGLETSKIIKSNNEKIKIVLYSMYDFNFHEKPLFIDAILKKDEIFEKLIPVIQELV